MLHLIETVGQLKQAMADVDNDVRVAIEDADTGWSLGIVGTELKNNLLLLNSDYKNRIETGE